VPIPAVVTGITEKPVICTATKPLAATTLIKDIAHCGLGSFMKISLQKPDIPSYLSESEVYFRNASQGSPKEEKR